MCAHFFVFQNNKSPPNPPWIQVFKLPANTWWMRKYHMLHRAIIGFNETIRNWHKERYFTSFSRGIGIQFSTSNNTTSLNDHWLVYRHCAKLRNWYKVEKYPSSYKQATSLSPNQSASYMHLFSSTMKMPKEIGINENSLKCKRSKLTWFCPPSTELQRNRAGPHSRGGAICHDFLM